MRQTFTQLLLFTAIASAISCSQSDSTNQKQPTAAESEKRSVPMMRGSGRPGDPLQPSQEYNDAYDAEQDAKLKSIKHYKPPVIVTPVDDTSDHFLVGDLASDAISSRVHAWLERYDISPHPGDTTKYPALYFSISVNDCKCGSSLVSVHLSVLDDVALQRNPTIAFRTNIWDKTEKVMVNKDNSHDEISSAITHVLDQFSLAYLAGTR